MAHQKSWELVLDHACLLGEGPVWDPIKQNILWLDIFKKEIHQFSPATKRHNVMDTGQMVGAIAFRASGGVIAALHHGFAAIDLEKETVHLLSDPEPHLPANRFNDGKCDPAGRFWAGTMDNITESGDLGNLYSLNKDQSVTLRYAGVSVSNGLAWSGDKKTMYYIDSPTRQVMAFDFDLESGDISNKQIVIEMTEADGYPDGMTIDSEGMLWIAHWSGWKVTRWDPRAGKLLTTIAMPTAHISSCTFGGEMLEDLYITSAKKDSPNRN